MKDNKTQVTYDIGPKIGKRLRPIVLLPALMMVASGIWGYSKALGNPRITEPTKGTTPNGEIENVIVKLSDPSVMDRFMAALPALGVLLVILAAAGYVMRSNIRLVMKGLSGEDVSERKMTALGISCIFLVVAQLGATEAASAYFGGDVVDSSGIQAGVLTAMALIMFDAVTAKKFWMKDHKRADILDEKMQDVV